MGLILVGAFAELATLGAVLAFVALITDPGRALSNPLLHELFGRFGRVAPEQMVLPVTLIFVAVILAAGVVRLLLAWVSQRFVFRLGFDLGVEVYRRTLHQPYEYHVATNTSALIAATNNVQTVIRDILLPLTLSLNGIVVSAFIFAALLAIDGRTALIAAASFGGLYVVVTFATRRRLFENSRIIARSQAQRVQTVQEGLGGIRDVLLDQAQPVYLAKFARVDSELRDAQALNAFIRVAPRYAIETFGMVLIGLVALALSNRPGGVISALPVLAALAVGAQRLLPLLQMTYSGWAQIGGARAILFDLLDILDLPIGADSGAVGQVPRLPFAHSISLDRVSFRYAADRAEVVTDVTLRIDKGARVGFVGKTGSGKSTVMDLILGLLQPTAGEIRIDGELLTPETVRGWRAQIAHVPQAIYLADASIAENIAFGAQGRLDPKQLVEAARKARLDGVIDRLPNGYDTIVGERGVRLSGGQRQSLGIARALYRNASVLVFDEATSALDAETEAAVMDAIYSLDGDLTILLIAHRLSTVSRCDKVVKLDEGRIVAEDRLSLLDPARVRH